MLILVALFLLAVLGSHASAQSAERIETYDVAIAIEPDGALRIVETIRYDFGSAQRRGILRDIPVRLRYDDRYDRLYRLQVLDVRASEGASDRHVVEEIGSGRARIRIGDPDVFITGAHTYEITYRIQGAFNGFADHDELYWNAIGTDWAVPIGRATVTIDAPAQITQAACYSGPAGSSLPCASGSSRGSSAIFMDTDMRPYDGLTLVIGIPTGVVPDPQPILTERWSLRRAFAVTPYTVGASVLLLLAVAGAVTRLVWLGGRDRRWAGSPVDVVFGSAGGEVERVGLFERNLYPLEYVPPDGLKPGEIGVLIDEIAHPVDVTATIVDLAARGYLRIEEIEAEPQGLLRRPGKPDWLLVRLHPERDDLVTYERVLLDGLFESGDEVELSSLSTKFVSRLQQVQEALYEAVVEHGWFPRSPKATRERWLFIGIAVLILGVLVQAAATAWTHAALVPLALPLGGLALLATHTTMPHRTPRGTAAMVRVRGFRRFIETAEAERSRFAENANLFYEYLPYAVVFGATEKWANAFAGLDQQPTNPGWYRSSQPFSVGAFAGSLQSFSVTSTGTIASTPGGSGSSGFSSGSSGGGGGGGGGGSW